MFQSSYSKNNNNIRDILLIITKPDDKTIVSWAQLPMLRE